MKLLKRNLLYQIISIIFLIQVNVSCSEAYKNKKIPENIKKEHIAKKFKTIDSCLLFNNHISIYESESRPKEVFIKLNNNLTSKKIILDSLNFYINILQNTSIHINCSQQNKFQIFFEQYFGNNYYYTYHLFEKDSISKEYKWSKTYVTESTRQGISIAGAVLKKPIKFTNYEAQYDNDTSFVSIYTFGGFQEGKEPTIKSYYNKIKGLEKIHSKEIKLIGDKFVLDYLTHNIAINTNNVLQYNKICNFLIQSKLYNEAIYLSKKIITKFPDNTVAYANMGDAYWKNNKKKAITTYKKYIKLMKKKHKEKQILEYIINRI